MRTYSAGIVTAYGSAKAGGYTGTYAEFCEALGNLADVLEDLEGLTVVANTLPEGSTATASYTDGVLTLGIPKGDKGDKGDRGETGNGIASIVKTSTSGLVDTYTITYTDGNTETFTVTNGAKGDKGDTGETGNGIESVELTSTSGAVKTYTITFTDSTTTTFDVTDGEVTNESLAETLEDYALTDGYYEEMTVGDAEQLVATQYVEDSEPYLFRTTGGSADVGNREYVDEIVGGTVAWNQLVNSGDTSVTVQSGHKYYSNINNTKAIGSSNGSAISINDSTKDNVIDLTQMFSTTIADYIYTLEQANAGAGVAFFKKYFPKDYYPYNAGEMLHVKTSEFKTVGFNQWDIATEYEPSSFDFNGSTLTNKITDSKTQINLAFLGYRGNTFVKSIRSLVFISSVGKQQILFTTDTEYDRIRIKHNGSARDIVLGHFTGFLPNTTYCLSMDVIGYNPSVVGGLRLSDICINLHWDGTRDGEYEPYTEHSYPLDDSLTLRGIPKLDSDNNLYFDGDTYEHDGTVTRKYGIVDLGTLNWTYDSGEYWRFRADLPSLALGSLNLFCTRYETDTANHIYLHTKDKTIGSHSSVHQMWVYDTAYTNASATEFKTAMSGVYLVYELATPTTESAEPYQQVQICDDFGTEEFVSTSIVPVGHNTRYPDNLRDKLQHLPHLADSDGYYMISQQNNSMSLELFRIPKAPTSPDGTYKLVATVSGGTPTYSWVAEE